MKSKHINLIAYNDFENLQNFIGNLDTYRNDSLISAEGYLKLIKKILPKKQITVLEVGSGNSSTLFALEKSGILKKGYGIEVSKSRFEFAELWKKEWGYTRVENINDDINRINFENFQDLDLCICVDFVLHTFTPIKKSYPSKLLKNIYRSLRTGGKILLELSEYKDILNNLRNGRIKFWQEFPIGDPWRYVLHDCKYDAATKILNWNKRYIKRNEFGFSESAVILRMYKRDEICSLFRSAGFNKVKLYPNLKGISLKDDNSEYFAIGTK